MKKWIISISSAVVLIALVALAGMGLSKPEDRFIQIKNEAQYQKMFEDSKYGNVSLLQRMLLFL